MAGLKFKGIKKVYSNGVVAVQDFNLEIDDKEFVIFVGPSGCGKSTTLRMIAGLEEISEGELYIDDKLINSIPSKDRDIAMVFQNYALYPHMTVFDNMAFGLKMRKLPKDEIEKRVHEAAQILGIEELLTRKPNALSGGQRQRVAMGRAIVREPKVFLMDEPLSNLDAKLRVQMRTEISKTYQRLKTTFVYVTHDQTEAMTLGTKIVVMKDGFIQQVDSPSNLYNYPVNMFVAGFMGSPQMNFINGHITKEESQLFLNFGSYTMKLPQAKAKILEDKGYAGKEVYMGIRPENIYDHSTGENEAGAVEARVEVKELLGSEIYLYLESESQPFTAKVSTDNNADVGQQIKVYIDLDKIHIFDKDSEEAIVH